MCDLIPEYMLWTSHVISCNFKQFSKIFFFLFTWIFLSLLFNFTHRWLYFSKCNMINSPKHFLHYHCFPAHWSWWGWWQIHSWNGWSQRESSYKTVLYFKKKSLLKQDHRIIIQWAWHIKLRNNCTHSRFTPTETDFSINVIVSNLFALISSKRQRWRFHPVVLGSKGREQMNNSCWWGPHCSEL